VAGFLLSQFGRIPDVGDRIEVKGWRFEVVDLDGRRIDKLLAVKMSDVPAQAGT
jgi:putative hemolysin